MSHCTRTLLMVLIAAAAAWGHDIHQAEESGKLEPPRAFEQLGEMLPTPNRVRTASGAPGPDYWQQKVDYVIRVSLDAEKHRLSGRERITYHNNSPHELRYLWVQLDQNRFRPDSIGRLARTEPELEKGRSTRWMRRVAALREFEGGVEVESVQDADGGDLEATIVQTMMRIDLAEPLASGESFEFSIAWSYNIPEARLHGARGGYEWFEKKGNAIYGIAQWFPRLCAYTDYGGWQNKQFIGSGEFTLEFGDYEVHITVPDTFVVSATGELQNLADVLTADQIARLDKAGNAETPVFVISPEEAKANEQKDASGTRTWIYKASTVRDFAFAASPKFIWDAMRVEGLDRPVLAMSLYPPEAEPLWSKYATHAVAQAVETYSHHALPYPYPVAIAINGPVGGGMEYPMICFNAGRPEEDGTYSERRKKGLIAVIIHEVGHNWFPMIINSDERQWTWMDEGLNTFAQYLAQRAWEKDLRPYPGDPKRISPYMASEDQVPIMTNSESILQFGNNAYRKPATALHVLRESVLGRELFDFAFREYARRWAFKRPQPADLFRTLEDASGVDLDWFWRGWFYSTDQVDVALEGVDRFTLRTRDPDRDKKYDREQRDKEPRTLSEQRSAGETKRIDRFPELEDFYNRFDELDVTPEDRKKYREFVEELEKKDAAAFDVDFHFYVVRFRNVGGLVTPLPLRVTYEDASTEEVRIPAEIWRRNDEEVARLFVTDKPIARFEFDPHWETADTDRSNNDFPAKMVDRTFGLTPREKPDSPMRIARRREHREAAREAAQAMAARLFALWKEKGAADTAPADVLTPEAANDPWDRPFVVVLSRATGEGKKLKLAWIQSDGPDRKPETDDDFRFKLYRDGRLEDD